MSSAGKMSTLHLLATSDAPAQSMLHPAGPAGAEIAWLWWIMFGAFTAVFILVIVLLLYGIFRGSSGMAASETGTIRNAGTVPPWGGTGFVVAGGIILPVLVLTPLYVYSLTVSARLRMPEDALTIRVVGHMWWWEVRYPESGVVSANEIHIPAGKPVRLELTSTDVIHSFWVPRLNGKRDMIPGVENAFWIQADESGVFRGQCGEYCGTQHANMAFEVIALQPADFDAWLVAQKAKPPEPETSITEHGLRVFLTAGCVQCHSIQGTQAAGNVGPDLTHLGSRRMIGGAMLPNTRGNLAGWIADPQAIKPGIKMPRTYLEADDLQALVSYLESLQ
ncbi:MAG: cytochrome c oxidase subunit II [Planctomycetaceae bacterium]